MSQVAEQTKEGGKPPLNRSILLVSLGSNIDSAAGSRKETLQLAVSALTDAGAVIRAQSRFFATPAMPAGIGPDFVNAALALEAGWAPLEALTLLHDIEARMGRRRARRWGERAIDMDLLAMNDIIQPDLATLRVWMNLAPDQQRDTAPGQLILPHPRMHQRAFVLVPLAEVAPNWVHPATRKTVLQMRDALPRSDLDTIRVLE